MDGGRCAKSREGAEENESEETVDGGGSNTPITWDEMLRYLGKVEEIDAGRDGCDDLTDMNKTRHLCSTGRRVKAPGHTGGSLVFITSRQGGSVAQQSPSMIETDEPPSRV